MNKPIPAGRSAIFFYDFETVPDETRFPPPTLKEVPVRVSKESRLDVDLDDFIGGTVAEIRKEIESPAGGFSDDQYETLISMEKNAKKSRATVIKLLEAQLSTNDTEAAAIADENSKAMDVWRKEGSVNPFKARICAFGYAGMTGDAMGLTARTDDEERCILEVFWQQIERNRKRSGYNILHFDDLLAVVRSIILEVPIPRPLDRRKYGNPEAIDVMVALFPSGQAMKCKDVCNLMGIIPPAGDMDGSKVFDLYQANDMDAIAKYVMSDVVVERELYLKFADAMKM